jgi:hypothetical protein
MVDMRDDRDVAKVLRGVRGHVLRQGPVKARKKGAKYSGLCPASLQRKKLRSRADADAGAGIATLASRCRGHYCFGSAAGIDCIA